MSFLRLLLISSLFISTSIHAKSPELTTVDGQKIALQSLKGKWVFINYWASWCSPCLHEIPVFNQFYEAHQKDNIAVFGVNYDGVDTKEQLPLIQQYQLHYPSLVDPADNLHLGDIKGVPVTFVFDPNGKLLDTKYGEQSADTLNTYLKKNI